MVFGENVNRHIHFSWCILQPFFLALKEASSRASYLALVVVLIIFLSRKLNNLGKIAILISLALIPLIAAHSFPEKFEKFKAGDVRKDLWEGSLTMLIDNPNGVGSNNFKRRYPPYDTPEHKRHLHHPDETTHPHNQFLLIGIENGLLALFGFGVICLFILKKGQEGNNYDWLFLIGFTILLIQGFFDKALSMPPSSLLFPYSFQDS